MLGAHKPRLVPLSVGMPRDVEWQGRVVSRHLETDGAWVARRLNIYGDGPGDLQGHGGGQSPVYAYQLDSAGDSAEQL